MLKHWKGLYWIDIRFKMDILILKRMPRIKDASIFSDFGKLIKVTVIYSVIYCHRREYFFSIISTFIEIKKKQTNKKPGRFFLLLFYRHKTFVGTFLLSNKSNWIEIAKLFFSNYITLYLDSLLKTASRVSCSKLYNGW